MKPNLPSILANSMSPTANPQAASPLNQVTQGSPNFQPGLAPTSSLPTPEKSPATEIRKSAFEHPAMPLHRAFQRRGLNVPPQVQSALQANPMTPQPVSDGVPSVQEPSQAPINPKAEANEIVHSLSERLQHHSKTESKEQDLKKQFVNVLTGMLGSEQPPQQEVGQ